MAGLLDFEEPPPPPGSWEWRRFLAVAKFLKALSRLGPDDVLDCGKDSYDWRWSAAEDLQAIGLAQFFQRRIRPGAHKCYWVARLTPKGRALVDELGN